MARYGTALRCATVQSRAASSHIITNMYANHLLLWKRHLDNYFLTSATKLLWMQITTNTYLSLCLKNK